MPHDATVGRSRPGGCRLPRGPACQVNHRAGLAARPCTLAGTAASRASGPRASACGISATLGVDQPTMMRSRSPSVASEPADSSETPGGQRAPGAARPRPAARGADRRAARAAAPPARPRSRSARASSGRCATARRRRAAPRPSCARRSRAPRTASRCGMPTSAWCSPTSAISTSTPRSPPTSGRAWRSPSCRAARGERLHPRGDRPRGGLGRRAPRAAAPRPGEPFERRLADGRWLRICDRRTADGGVVTLHSDITELKRQAEELRAREAQLRGIVDNIPGVVYRRIRHPDGRITYPYHSPQIELRHGLDAAAVANDARVLQDAVHPDDRAAWLRGDRGLGRAS